MMVLEEKIDESSLVDIRTRITTTNGLINLQDLVSADDEAAE
jgi:hypothetical protein